MPVEPLLLASPNLLLVLHLSLPCGPSLPWLSTHVWTLRHQHKDIVVEVSHHPSFENHLHLSFISSKFSSIIPPVQHRCLLCARPSARWIPCHLQVTSLAKAHCEHQFWWKSFNAGEIFRIQPSVDNLMADFKSPHWMENWVLPFTKFKHIL